MNFGERLKALRKSRGWTQAELAEKLKVKQQLIGHYEKGLHHPPLPRLKEISRIFQVNFEDLLGPSPLYNISNKKRINKKSRTAQLFELFDELQPEDQRTILKMVKSLINQHQNAS